jgi:potassium efflux system protein
MLGASTSLLASKFHIARTGAHPLKQTTMKRHGDQQSKTPLLRVAVSFSHRLFLVLILLMVWFPVSWAAKNPELPSDTKPVVTSQILKAKIKDVERTTDLSESTKKKLLELYRKSLTNLETAAANNALADKLAQSIETAPAETKKIREEMGKPGRQPAGEEIDIPTGATMKEIEQLLLKAKTNFTAIEAKVATLTSQLSGQVERPAKVSQRLAEVKKSEEELLTALKGPPPADESLQVMEARQWMQQTQLQALHSETKMLNQELVSMPVLLERANAQREQAVSQLERARGLTQRLEAKINQERQGEAAKTVEQTEEAMRQVADRPHLLQQAAAENTGLGDELQSSTAELERITTEKDYLGEELKKLEGSLKNTRQKIELAGVSQALGFVLRERERNLPDERLLRKKIAANEELIAETGLRLMQHEEEQKRLKDINGYVAELTTGFPPEEAQKIDTELRGLLASRQELLDKIIAADQSTISLLAEADSSYRQIFNAVTSFKPFLAKHLLWMRSIPSLHLNDLSSVPREVAALLSPRPWLASGKQLAKQAVTSPALLLVYLVTAVLLWSKKRQWSQLDALVSRAGDPATYSFALTVKIVALTLLLALPWPLLFMTLGWQIQTMAEATEYSRAVAAGLLKFSYRFYLLRSLSMLLLPKGLAAVFFHWPETTLALLRRETTWLQVTFLPTVFLTQVAFTANYHVSGGFAFARLAFLLTLASLAVSFYRILHPRTGIWQDLSEEKPRHILARLYPVFFFLAMLLFLLFSGLILSGFINSVGMLMSRFIDSLWLALGLIVCHQLVAQWLIQSRRRFALQGVVHHRPSLRPVERGQQSITPDVATESTVDLNLLNTESSQLLDTLMGIAALIGLWMVWADVLPAFRIFDEFTLWKYTVAIGGETKQMPVTLANAALAVLIGIITLTATRHFPALLEIVLLRYLDMTAGSRYTATTLSRYVIGGIGLLSVADLLGFSWAQIQWLVAALGVGIGFGLQEIVANFISGLIILFERPIRVGDVVTIGSTDGVVTRIRMRATTIRDFDRKELLVPNKEFISGRLLNWSLSDPVTRIMIPVGLAYGGDVQKAMALMVEAAKENSMVLEDPIPITTFDGFGDNALLLTLRCFIGSVDYRIPAKSDLHKAIEQKFREAGLSMAFPQRDVHLDTSKPLDIRISREKVPSQGNPFPRGEG